MLRIRPRAAIPTAAAPNATIRTAAIPSAAVPAVEIVCGAIALALLAPSGAAAQEVFTISPGHEEVVLAMTGGSDRLRGGCALDAASIDRVLVSARYRCDDGSTPVIVLRHPSTSDAPLRTTSFAIEPSPDAPRELVDEVVSRVRAHESELRWDVSSASPGPQPGPSSAVLVGIGSGAGAIVLAATGAIVWWRRRRRAASDARPS